MPRKARRKQYRPVSWRKKKVRQSLPDPQAVPLERSHCSERSAEEHLCTEEVIGGPPAISENSPPQSVVSLPLEHSYCVKVTEVTDDETTPNQMQYPAAGSCSTVANAECCVSNEGVSEGSDPDCEVSFPDNTVPLTPTLNIQSNEAKRVQDNFSRGTDTLSNTVCCDVEVELTQDDVAAQPADSLLPSENMEGMLEQLSLSDAQHTSSPGLSSTPSLQQEVIQATIPHLKKRLPGLWQVLDNDGTLHILKFSSKHFKVVQRTIHIDKDLRVTASFHGKDLPSNHSFYEDIKNINFHSHLPEALATDIYKIVSAYRLYEVCQGIPQLKFKSLWNKDNTCFTDENHFQEIRYTRTCRSHECQYAVPQRQSKCSECSKVLRRFRKKAVFKEPKLSPSGRMKTPSRFKSNKNLNTPEKDARMKRFAKEIRNLKEKNQRLRVKIDVLQRMLTEEGVNLDDGLSDSLHECLAEADQTQQLSEFHKLFLEQQLKAAEVKGPTGMRWHPLMIRFALQIKMASSVAYTTMAQSGFMKLPGLRTLFDYTSAMSVKEGVHHDIIEDVCQAVKGLKFEYQKFHVLVFDEVAVCQGLAQKKSTGMVVGYCHLDKVKEEMVNLEKHVSEVAQELTPQPLKKVPMVKKMLSFMVKGTASSVQSVVASYGVSLLTKEDLHNYTWEVVEWLEMSGIQVIAFVSDGSPINRGFFNMQPPASTDSKVIYDTVNPYAPARRIFFISDPPHLMKTIRNCLYNSGNKGCRKLTKNGETMLWSTIIQLFKLKSTQTVKKLFKLTAPCVFLNSYSRMKVAYAVRVLSRSVAEVLQDLKWPNTAQLSIFAEV